MRFWMGVLVRKLIGRMLAWFLDAEEKNPVVVLRERVRKIVPRIFYIHKEGCGKAAFSIDSLPVSGARTGDYKYFSVDGTEERRGRMYCESCGDSIYGYPKTENIEVIDV